MKQGSEFRKSTSYLDDHWSGEIFWKMPSHGGDDLATRDIKTGKVKRCLLQKK